MSSTAAPLGFDLFDVGRADDPYPAYRRLRELEPVHRGAGGLWVLSRYRDVVAAQQDPRFDFFSERARALLRRARDGSADPADPVAAVAARYLLLAEPGAHHRFRSALGCCFAAPAVERLRARVAGAIDDLLDRLQRRAGAAVDLMEEFVRPLPTAVAMAVVGLPPGERERYARWSAAIGRIEEIGLSPRRMRQFRDAVEECEADLRRLLGRRPRGAGDLLSPLLDAPRRREAVGDAELVTMLALALFGAAYATTASLLGNAVLALLLDPASRSRLRTRPELAAAATEELLRYDTSVQHHNRWTLTDVEVGGRCIPAGSRVVLLIGAANRDPDRFSGPDHLDLTRAGVRPASFGGGEHVCLGANLARLEVAQAITGLFRRFPGLRPPLEPPRWRRDAPGLRGLESLIVRLEEAA